MKLFRLSTIFMIVIVCFVTGLALAQENTGLPPGTTFDYAQDRVQYEGLDVTQEPVIAAVLPQNMESALVPCGDGVTGPCDMIATKPEDIAGVWKQYLQGSFFNAPGEVAYIRFNANGTFSMADSIENTTKPFQNYPTGTFKFDGQNWSSPLVLNDSVPAPCVLDTDAYQARVIKYGDAPVALRFVFISDGCTGRVQDWTQPLMWVAPSQ